MLCDMHFPIVELKMRNDAVYTLGDAPSMKDKNLPQQAESTPMQ